MIYFIIKIFMFVADKDNVFWEKMQKKVLLFI